MLAFEITISQFVLILIFKLITNDTKLKLKSKHLQNRAEFY